MVDSFDGYAQNDHFYGGTAGIKVGITIDDRHYMLKYPTKLKGLGMKNVFLSYSNSPVSEHIGCRIYESVGIPAQNTILGMRSGKEVVACEDFLAPGDRFIPYSALKATFEPAFTDPQGDITNGTGTVLPEIIRTFSEHPFLQKHAEAEERFWRMFVVDTLLGNPDRNNENWGFIQKANGEFALAPVFDCGNCLNSKLTEEQIENSLQDEGMMLEIAIRRPCVFERVHGKRICACQYILRADSPQCNKAVEWVVPRIERKEIIRIVNETPFISEGRKTFYLKLMQLRYDRILLPAYRKAAA
ncbi:MAG: CtkA family protein [Eubacteriales bacterium]|nr:CtkA family protein [Eubacteriales bacterium]